METRSGRFPWRRAKRGAASVTPPQFDWIQSADRRLKLKLKEASKSTYDIYLSWYSAVQAMCCIQLQKLADRARRLSYKGAMEQTPHILFVEDDADIRTLVADVLTGNGYRMSVARDSREFDRTLEISRIDLREGHLVADIEADRSKMAARRWADDAPHNGEPR